MGIFEDFLSGVVSDCVNAKHTKHCPTCEAIIDSEEPQCFDCQERRAYRDARNDGGVEEV
jgi:hypothetical protein